MQTAQAKAMIIHENKAKNIIKTISEEHKAKISMNKKFNDVGIFYQIVVEKFLGHENAFLKFKLETNTKKNAKVHCKARVNDNYLNAVQKYYEDKKINYPEYKINIDHFNDGNNENHINITFLSTPEETINTTLDKMLKIFTEITANITADKPIQAHILEASQQSISELILETETKVVETKIVPVVEPVPDTQIPNTDMNNVEYIMPPMFNDFELSIQSLDAEQMHIHTFEMYIKDMQHNLEIMKKKHTIRIKCYNDIISINCGEDANINNAKDAKDVKDAKEENIKHVEDATKEVSRTWSEIAEEED